MIKYDYIIQRNEGNETVEYRPELIPTQLPDLVYVQGPNSSGKSTLLNIIALAFFAEKLKKDELDFSLREKIEDLRNLDHQKLTFNIEIHNEAIGKTYKSIKTNPGTKDIKVVEIDNGNERIITANDFFKEFKLIYDIPTDPLRRLKELLRELKNAQANTEFEVSQLRRRIGEAITGIEDGKNPEHLKNLEEEIKTLQSNKAKLENNIISEEQLLSWLKEYVSLKFFVYYKNQVEQITIQLENARQTKSTDEKKEKELTKKEIGLINRMNIRINQGSDLFDEIIRLLEIIIPKEYRNRLSIWKSLKIRDEIQSLSTHGELFQDVKFFLNILRQIELDDNEDEMGEARFLKELLKLLREFRHTKIFVPGTGKKIDEFIKDLELDIKQKERKINKTENIDTCIKKLDELLKILNEGLSDSSELRQLKSRHKLATKIVNKHAESELEKQLATKLDSLVKKRNHYQGQLSSFNIDIAEADAKLNAVQVDYQFQLFNSYNESQLNERISNTWSELIDKKEQSKKIERQLEIYQDEKSRIEKKEPHKYQKYLAQLKSVRKTVVDLEKKFSDNFQENVNKIINGDTTQLTNEQKKYADKVAIYLAAKLHTIKHIRGTYEVVKIDTILEKITTTSGKEILFSDLGTGQSQAAYLQGLLSMTGNRKVIALFDEVAMMDSQTLKPIFDTLKALYDEKKLLLAIIVQRRDDQVQVQSLNEI